MFLILQLVLQLVRRISDSVIRGPNQRQNGGLRLPPSLFELRRTGRLVRPAALAYAFAKGGDDLNLLLARTLANK